MLTMASAFCQDRYEVVDLGAPMGALGSQAKRINSVGTVIGESYPGDRITNAWVYLNNVMSDIGVLRELDTSAAVFGINAQDVVAGRSYDKESTRGFLWNASDNRNFP